MYIVPIAWLYVALMMAVAEATNSNGSVLGAIITFVVYGLGPVALVIYLMSTPARKRAIKAREAEAMTSAPAESADLAESSKPSISANSPQPDTGSHAPATAQSVVIPPVRKEP